MNKLNPEKLNVEWKEGVTPIAPIWGRKYTLTHSDSTAELFLTVGLTYALEKINPMRDEVLAKWCKVGEQCFLAVYCYIDGGEFEVATAELRDAIFRRELPLALEAIRYGDRELFRVEPILGSRPILVYFSSRYPDLNQMECWGCMDQYQ